MKRGTQVYFLVGNHDEFLREYTPLEIENLSILDEVIHIGQDGKKYLVIHGDLFDQFTLHFGFLYQIGDFGYSVLLFINRWVNAIRRKLRLKYWSLSKLCKQKVKQAVNYINNFEHCLMRYAKQKGCDGVISGHIHTAAVKEIDGLQYYNCGDWVDSCSAVIENLDGSFELIHIPISH